ncbi:hypothetical protein IAG44_00975 [Streptomyces roseirectus]|uniref:Uncharacterized protein n=1 Tax=Streptomyces roseirectus TaxID=2768066 RepID=A0A7H0I5W1_9ACTN|nr:hypothetical protein [Streptomyces roseirectus]QNP68177.1 hypothetical protein IAG44_00975 [Streptomyces roseirectus]
MRREGRDAVGEGVPGDDRAIDERPEPWQRAGLAQGGTPFAASDRWLASSRSAGTSCRRGTSVGVRPSNSSVRLAPGGGALAGRQAQRVGVRHLQAGGVLLAREVAQETEVAPGFISPPGCWTAGPRNLTTPPSRLPRTRP